MEGERTEDAVPSRGKGFLGALGRGSLEIWLSFHGRLIHVRADPWVTATQRLPGLQQPLT